MKKRSALPVQTWTYVLPDTPVGPLRLFFTTRGLAALYFGEVAGAPAPGGPLPASLAPLKNTAVKALTGYFAGGPTAFPSLALDLQGTPFQLRVWRELRRIPWGATVSYQALAARLGNPKSARAVGQAVGANPLPVIIPCHRVIARNGSLGGYSSGLERKRWLLRHEGAL